MRSSSASVEEFLCSNSVAADPNISSPSSPVFLASWQQLGCINFEKVHGHFVFDDGFLWFTVLKPQESQHTSVIWVNIEAIKHMLNVTRYGNVYADENE